MPNCTDQLSLFIHFFALHASPIQQNLRSEQAFSHPGLPLYFLKWLVAPQETSLKLAFAVRSLAELVQQLFLQYLEALFIY